VSKLIKFFLVLIFIILWLQARKLIIINKSTENTKTLFWGFGQLFADLRFSCGVL
jgi:hypothetical protein